MTEIDQLISTCYIHLREAESWVSQGNLKRAEFRARELAENARLLSNALFYEMHVSGEVLNKGEVK
jgi:hypothetical protein